MKRLLAFLVIFGVGLSVLFFLQGERAETPVVEGPSPIEVPEDNEFGLIPVAAPESQELDPEAGSPPKLDAAPGEEEVTGRAGLHGKTRFVRYDKETGETLFTLEAEDSRTLEDQQLRLEDVTVTYPGVGVLHAKRGRVQLKQKGALVIQGDLGSHIELEEGVLTLDEDHALAPARFTSPKIEGDLDSRVFLLSGQPRLESQALLLGGRSIKLELEKHRVTVVDEAHADVLDEAGQPRRSLTGDTLVLAELGPERVHMKADGAARLTIATGRPEAPSTTLTAPAIGLEAVRTQSELTLTDVQVSGGRGTLEVGDARVTGEAFDFEIGERGDAGQVTVTGAPSVSFPTQLLGELQPDALDDGGSITLDSQEELLLTFDRDLEVLTLGSSTLGIGDLALTAAEGFEGYRDEGARELYLLGRGGVTLAGVLPPNSAGIRHAINYRADQLAVRHTIDGAASKVQLTSDGLTKVDVEGDDGEAHFTATGGLIFVSNSDAGRGSWLVPHARGLDFELVSEGVRTTGFAAEIRDFKPDQLHFEGHELSFERSSLEGSQQEGASDPYRLKASGSLVTAHGEDDLSIVGAHAKPAHFERMGLALDARSLVRKGSTLTAKGFVRAKLGHAQETSSFECEELLIEGLEMDASSEGAATASRLFAEGSVRSSSQLAGEAVGLEADRVEVLNLGGEEFELHARGGVRLTLEEEGASWSVTADRLDGFGAGSEERPPEDGGSWLELAARGNVEVRETERELLGRGSALYLERGPHSRMLLEGGELPAWVTSRLPGGGLYKGQVRRLEVTEEEVSAEELVGTIEGVFLPGDDPEAEPSNLELSSDHLNVHVEREAGKVQDIVQLDGDVQLSRKRSDDSRDTLRAQFATFTHLRHEELGAAETGAHAFDVENTAFLAHGQVILKSGYIFQALGDHLEVAKGTRKLHIEGTPASITFGGLCTMNTWITVDLDNMGIEGGRGFVCQDPALIKRLLGGEER